MKVGSDDLGLALGTPQIEANASDHLGLVRGSLPAKGVSLDILVEELVGAQVRAVAGEEEHGHLLSEL